MPSIELIKGSDGTGNASMATVQTLRSPSATTIIVNTVTNIPSTFYGSMGTPHTFIDPITGETITVISEASAVDFQGHVDGSNIEIDAIAPGYTDIGSQVGDIIVIKPTTEWANNVADVLDVSHNDDGTLKVDDNGSIKDENGNEQVKFSTTASAVNELTIKNAATATAPQIQSTGGDTNIDLRLIPKGTGNVKKGATGGSIDWWEELGRVTLGVAGDTISVASLPARKYLRFIVSTVASGNLTGSFRFNNDTGNNYSWRASYNGGADTSAINTSRLEVFVESTGVVSSIVAECLNVASLAKIFTAQYVSTNGATAGTLPARGEYAGKWINASDQISRVDFINTGAGDFAIGSELVVLGHD